MRIKRATINRGVREIARAAGVSHASISRIARGKQRPSDELAQKFQELGIEFPAKRGGVNAASNTGN